MNDPLTSQLEANYKAFNVMLPGIMQEHLGEFALMRDGKIIEFFKSVVDAERAGRKIHPDGIFSVQEVTDLPVDLGYFSHVSS